MMRILLSRWLFSLLGIVLLAALVMAFGPLWLPLVAILPRLLVVQTLIVVWAVANASVDWRLRAREKSLAAGLAAAGPGQEAEAVGQSLARALALVRRSNRQAGLTELPWYAIIGPPGAGKTTALMNAGLDFILPEQAGKAAISGVGGTRLCEWWFTRNAVLIDTAGRYTTQDSNEAVDRAGWQAFLSLLKRMRPRQPLNGVIVAIALSDIAEAPEAERNAHAKAIASRIAELEERFGLTLPVYVLLTKVDLLVGFMEFFDDLDQQERDQVWGETFTLGADSTPLGERFGAGLRELTARLQAKMLFRLQAEHRLERRGPIVGFPTQFSSLEKPLTSFLNAAFGQSDRLRGVYFASGTQEGTPIDRLTGAMARLFGIDRLKAAALRSQRGRSYFLGRLLRDVIFNEAMLLSDAPSVRRRRTILRSVGFAAIAAASIAAIGVLGWEERVANRQIETAAAALSAYERSAKPMGLETVDGGDLQPSSALLDQAEALQEAEPGLAPRFGLSQSGKLQRGAAGVYRHGLIYGLLPRLVWRLETEMRGDLGRPDLLTRVTATYLMLGGLGPLNADEVRNELNGDWQASWPGGDNASLRASLLNHLNRLLAAPLPPIALDKPLVAQAREIIAKAPLATRVYDRLRTSSASLSLPPWRPLDVLGLAGVQVFTRASGAKMTDAIAGFYTEVGLEKAVRPYLRATAKQVAAETWILGHKTDLSDRDLAALEKAVLDLYLADLTRRWDAMLADLDIAPIASLTQGAQSLYILASPESPLRAVLRSAATQLSLQGADTAGAVAHFHDLLELAGGDGAALERALRLIADMQQPLAKIAALPVGSTIPPGGDDIGVALNGFAVRQPQPLQRWLIAIAASAKALRTNNLRQQIVLAYNGPNGPFQACQAAVAHDPFTLGGTPLPIENFSGVFAPGGALDSFVNISLKPYLAMSGKVWRPQSAGTVAAPLGADDAAQFQRAAAIRDAFFPTAQSVPSLHVEIAPGKNEIRAAALSIGSTAVETGNGQDRAAEVIWPSIPPIASLTAEPPMPSITETGPWALFHLFGQGRMQPSGKTGLSTLSFSTSGAPLSFDIRLAGQANPFAPGLLTGFHCPVLR